MNDLKKNNVINLCEEKVTYRFKQEVCKRERVLPSGKKVIKENVLIMIERIKGDSIRVKVHPISEFLLQPMRKGGLPKVGSLKTKASYIVRFLNYILIDNNSEFKINDVYDLTFEHGTEFLNYYVDTGVKLGTVKNCENVLKELYFFLCKKESLKYISVNDFEYETKDNSDLYYPSEYIKSPFYGVEYPSEIQDNILHYLPKELIIIFIDTAITYTPEIALGVYFQFFGGLRVGEVVNISKSVITLKGPFGRYGIVVKLYDQKFRDDLKHYSSGGAVKKSRRQAIFPYKGGLLEKLYKTHISRYTATDGSNAIFVNKAGSAMADFSYTYYFSKLKNKFLERLKNSNNSDLKNYCIDLQAKKWSTHLGRGVFSNMIAEVANNIAQIRQARGDNSFDASFSYLSDSEKMAKELYNNQLDMWEMLLEEIENKSASNKD